jgi:tetratricopeptide (TPR) repeat protein
MRLRILLTSCALSTSFILSSALVSAQAPSSIQIFLPNGDRPLREMRMTLSRDDGRVEIVFTDSKGKFQLTGDLNRDREYDITIEGDNRTFETTSARLRLLRAGVTYLPIFLRPYKNKQVTATGVIDASMLDVEVPKEAQARYSEAMSDISNGRVREAVTLLKQAITIYPRYVRALTDLGVLYLKFNMLDEAVASLRQAVKVNSKYHVSRLNLGIALNHQGRFSEALEVIMLLYKENASLPGLRIALADSYIGANQLPAAKEVLRAALLTKTLDGAEEVEAHYKLGLVLSREELYQDAIAELRKAVDKDPKAANAHLLLGGALLQLKKYQEAEAALRRAYVLGQQSMGNAQLMLGQLYTVQQKYDLALAAFEQYLKDVPNAANAAQVRSGIEMIKKQMGREK